tara:strand:+ start:62 stop:595 length:534 start_codon:yes stop_codon:yes gene_type:complete
MERKKVQIETVKLDPSNPRSITKEKFEELKKSIKDFPEMEVVKPLIIADDFVIGGNMRLLAYKDLGYREVHVIDVTAWSQAKRDEFMIKDNTHFGSWDYDALANEWDNLPLTEWGVAVWDTELEELKEEAPPSFLRGINIDFVDDDYDVANELVGALKKSDTYVGAIVLEALRKEFK